MKPEPGLVATESPDTFIKDYLLIIFIQFFFQAMVTHLSVTNGRESKHEDTGYRMNILTKSRERRTRNASSVSCYCYARRYSV